MEVISNEKDIYEKFYDLFKEILNLGDDEEFYKVKVYFDNGDYYTIEFSNDE